MAQNATAQSQARLLLNAEPFGFGPTAAIAGFFPHLRPHFGTIGYMGKKHTLDLQRGLPYDAIHDMSGTARQDRTGDYAPVFDQYDVLLTAMDHKVMEEAQKAGLHTIYYDALSWYWPEIPDSVLSCDLYLAQDFFGVRERLRTTFARHADVRTVPPIAPAPKARENTQEKEHVLINLGGLQNPFWPIEEVTEYARTMIAVLRSSIRSSEHVVIAGSQAVAERLSDEGVRTYPRKEMESILARSKMAFMTSGLGNIYDAAAFDLPTIWLPPANDSQGQQLNLIEGHRMSDGALDWPDIMPDAQIDYTDHQPEVLARIAAAASNLAANPVAQNRLSSLAATFYDRSIGRQSSRTPEAETLPDDLYHLFYGAARRMLAARGFYCVHTACIGTDDHFKLVAGHSGAGKTTVTQNLIDRNDMKLLSGNKTVVRFDEAGTMKAVAGTKTMTALDRNLKRYAYELPESCYARGEKDITAIALIRINEGVTENQPLTPPSALHTLYPFFTDAVNADVIVNGGDLLDGQYDADIRAKLINHLARSVQSIPVRKLAGSPAFLQQKVLDL